MKLLDFVFVHLSSAVVVQPFSLRPLRPKLEGACKLTHASWYLLCCLWCFAPQQAPRQAPLGPAWEPAGAAGLDAVKVSWLRFEFAWIAVGVVIAVVVGAAWAVAVSVVSFSGSCLGCCCCGC